MALIQGFFIHGISQKLSFLSLGRINTDNASSGNYDLFMVKYLRFFNLEMLLKIYLVYSVF